MKINEIKKEVEVHYYVETDQEEFPEYRRNESGNWESAMGESWESWFDEKLEKAFQEYQAVQKSRVGNMKPTLCLDFDGVLHSYTSGWKGADVIPDPPVDGAIEFLWKALEKFHVCIFSTRNSSPNGIAAMRTWLANQDEIYWQDKPARPRTSLTLLIDFPREKPPVLVTIDDRAITFTGKFPDINSLINFKPWNK